MYTLSESYYFIIYLDKVYRQDSYNLSNIFYVTINLEVILRSCIISFWKKILFKGKSYKIKVAKNQTKITFRMGFSHWTKFRFYNFTGSIYRYTRQKFIVFTYNYYILNMLLTQIKKIRPINPYTKRGLRISQQNIKRRSGKLSQALSSLH